VCGGGGGGEADSVTALAAEAVVGHGERRAGASPVRVR